MNLPPEVAQLIASGLSAPDILNLCATSTYWAGICRDETFWRSLVQRDYPGYVVQPGQSWRDAYFILEEARVKPRFLTVSYTRNSVPQGGELRQLYLRQQANNSALMANDPEFYLPLGNQPILQFSSTTVYELTVRLLFPVLPRPGAVPTDENFFRFYLRWDGARIGVINQTRDYVTFADNYGTAVSWQISS
jgi:hypothetical protein